MVNDSDFDFSLPCDPNPIISHNVHAKPHLHSAEYLQKW